MVVTNTTAPLPAPPTPAAPTPVSAAKPTPTPTPTPAAQPATEVQYTDRETQVESFLETYLKHEMHIKVDGMHEIVNR